MKHEHIKEKKQADLNLYFCNKDENLQPGIVYGPVIRDCYVIECTTYGKGAVVINGTEFPISKGDCFILSPGDVIIHKTDYKMPREGVFCGIDGMKISSYLKEANITSKQPFAPPDVFSEVVTQIEKMIEMKNDTDPGAELRCRACLHTIFGEILRHTKKSEDGGIYVQKAISYMEMYYGLNLSIPDIAKEVGLERSYFSTLFKSKTGKTPHAFLTELRIKKACILIEMNTLPINEISNSVGIEPVNFSRVFKKVMGVLPNQYKKGN